MGGRKSKRRDPFERLVTLSMRTKELNEELEELKKEVLMELGRTLLVMLIEGQEMILPKELEAKLEKVKEAFSGELKAAKRSAKETKEASQEETGRTS